MTQQPLGTLPAASWYPDPDNAAQLRYWDGTTWTNHFTAAPVPHPMERQSTVVDSAMSVVERVAGVRRSSGEHRPVQTTPTLEQLVSSARLEDPRHPLDEQVEVAGETYYVKGTKRVFRDFGMPITADGCTIEEVQCILAPEPWNPHYPNAVAVMIGMYQVGHLPADCAVNYAAPLARLAATGVLATGVARLWAKTDAGIVRARVTILIPEAAQFA